MYDVTCRGEWSQQLYVVVCWSTLGGFGRGSEHMKAKLARVWKMEVGVTNL